MKIEEKRYIRHDISSNKYDITIDTSREEMAVVASGNCRGAISATSLADLEHLHSLIGRTIDILKDDLA